MRKEKQYLLDEVKSYLSQGPEFLLMKYEKLNANKANDFRREIVKRGGQVTMMRKRLLVKAAHENGFNLDLKQLPGHIGLVFPGADFLEATKFTFDFSKQTENALEVIGGRFEGEVHSANSMLMLSQLPGKDEMRAQLLGVLQAPLAETLAVIEALLCSVPHCLQNKVDKKD
jgi:large subunit ribosomal protein L10